MKYMFLIYGAEDCWTEQERRDCMLESMAVCDQLEAEGKYLASSPLHSVTTATSLRIREGKTLITDGPFAETTEQLGGYYIIEAEDLDEAIAVAKRLPPVHKGTVEIRPLFTKPERAQDLADTDELELSITRLVNVAPAILYRCWTEPDLLKQWFTPKPWQTVDCRIDLRPGGEFSTTMRGPEGQEFPNVGVFLEIVPEEKVVFTDAYRPGWVPAEAFFVGTVTFTVENGQTRYTATAKHWNAADCKKHESMGFHDGWNKALDQLLEVAASL